MQLIRISAYAFDPKTMKKMQMAGVVVKPDRQLYPEEQLRGKIDVSGGTGGESPPPQGRNTILHGMDLVIRYNPFLLLGAQNFAD